MSNQLIKLSEAAKLLSVTMQTLRNWEKSGKITLIRTKGNQRRISIEEVNKLLRG